MTRTRLMLCACAAALALMPVLILGADGAGRRNEKVYAAVQANRDGALALLKDMVNIDSGTGDVTGGAKVLAMLAPKLTALGAAVHMEKAEAPGLPDNLVAVFKGPENSKGKARILIIAHVDTVFGPGTVAGRPFSMDGSRAHGPGVGDEKAGVMVAMTALKILHDMGFADFADITLLLETSEERGSPGSTALIKTLAAAHDVEFNMEPGDAPDVITVWRKGSTPIGIQVKGRAAHAGMAPQDGRNAAMELIHQVTALTDAFPKSGDQITVNLTVLKSGERNNVIPDAAEALFSARYRTMAQLDQIVAKAKANAASTAIPDTSVTITGASGYPPLMQTPDVDALADRAATIYGEIGKTLGRGGNGGASESALAQSVGTPALDGLGLVGGNFHTDHEWVDLGSLTPRLYLFTRLLMDVAAKPPHR